MGPLESDFGIGERRIGVGLLLEGIGSELHAMPPERLPLKYCCENRCYLLDTPYMLYRIRINSERKVLFRTWEEKNLVQKGHVNRLKKPQRYIK